MAQYGEYLPLKHHPPDEEAGIIARRFRHGWMAVKEKVPTLGPLRVFLEGDNLFWRAEDGHDNYSPYTGADEAELATATFLQSLIAK